MNYIIHFYFFNRAQSRRWYLGQSDWIISHEIEDNVADLLDEANENENADELIPTVPKDDNPANNRCPVCKEDFIGIYILNRNISRNSISN